MEKRYKEIDGVRYQVIQNTILGSNVIPVGESLPEVTTSDNGKLLGVSSGEWTPVDAPGGGLTLYGPYEAIGTYTQVEAGGYYYETISTFTSRDPEHDSGETVTLPSADTDAKCFLCSYSSGATGTVFYEIDLPTYTPPEEPYPGEWSGLVFYGQNLLNESNAVAPFIKFMCTARLPVYQE